MKKEILGFIGEHLCAGGDLKLVQIDTGVTDPIINIRFVDTRTRKRSTAVFNERTLTLAASGDANAIRYAKQKVEQATGARIA